MSTGEEKAVKNPKTSRTANYGVRKSVLKSANTENLDKEEKESATETEEEAVKEMDKTNGIVQVTEELPTYLL